MVASLTALALVGAALLPGVAKTEEVAQFNMSGETPRQKALIPPP